MKILVVLSVVVLVMLCTGVIGDPNQCVFPFTFDGKTYNECTYASSSNPWCAYDHEYQRGRWDYCVCSESEERRCAALGQACIPAVGNKPMLCYVDPRNHAIGRR